MGEHLTKHGDGAKDVSFSVEDLDAIMERAKKKGVKVVKDILLVSEGLNPVHDAGRAYQGAEARAVATDDRRSILETEDCREKHPDGEVCCRQS